MRNRNARVTRAVAYAIGTVAALFAGYLLAGLVGGAVPVNTGWREPARGVTVWVESNGVHTGIVVPKVAAGVDWRTLARPEHLADPRYTRHDHLSFGWGERAFYLETPTWADMRPGTVIAAALGSDRTLIHVDHIPRPVADSNVRSVRLSVDQYRRLAAFIAASVAPGAAHARGYYAYDAFYEGRGRYDAVRTCNAWTGAALARAGVRIGAWTPFAATVLWWLPEARAVP